jgi:hypothetical protein
LFTDVDWLNPGCSISAGAEKVEVVQALVAGISMMGVPFTLIEAV